MHPEWSQAGGQMAIDQKHHIAFLKQFCVGRVNATMRQQDPIIIGAGSHQLPEHLIQVGRIARPGKCQRTRVNRDPHEPRYLYIQLVFATGYSQL